MCLVLRAGTKIQKNAKYQLLFPLTRGISFYIEYAFSCHNNITESLVHTSEKKQITVKTFSTEINRLLQCDCV